MLTAAVVFMLLATFCHSLEEQKGTHTCKSRTDACFVQDHTRGWSQKEFPCHVNPWYHYWPMGVRRTWPNSKTTKICSERLLGLASWCPRKRQSKCAIACDKKVQEGNPKFYMTQICTFKICVLRCQTSQDNWNWTTNPVYGTKLLCNCHPSAHACARLSCPLTRRYRISGLPDQGRAWKQFRCTRFLQLLHAVGFSGDEARCSVDHARLPSRTHARVLLARHERDVHDVHVQRHGDPCGLAISGRRKHGQFQVSNSFLVLPCLIWGNIQFCLSWRQ